MNIYNDYLNAINTAMTTDPKGGNLNESLHSRDTTFSKGFTYSELNKRIPRNSLQPGLQQFSLEMGLVPDFGHKLGLHPDFAYLKTNNGIEKHYIVSMFVDIKNSTILFRKYTPETVLVITNTIQRAAIHTCLILGGYVHRLQGDGLFVYFGGRNIPIKIAVEHALQFASLFTHFVQNDLHKLFNEKGIEAIFTRIGVDLGYNEDVVWALAGLGEISEVTTCSLHTSLASKMQAHAQSNGIVVGNHIVNEAANMQSFFTPVCKRTGDENDRYIFKIPEEGFNYTQYDFSWLPYLKQQSFIATDLTGDIQLKRKPAQNQDTASLGSLASSSKSYLR